MSILSRQPEVAAADPQIFSFDDEMSDAMAEGVATIWQIQANAERLRGVEAQLGSQAADLSDSVIEHASAILTSKGLEKLAEREELDPAHAEDLFSEIGRKLSPHDTLASEALSKMGYLALLSGAENAVIDKINEEWQEEYASRIVGKQVLLWMPANWEAVGPGPLRYNARYYSFNRGLHTNMTIGSGNAITGKVAKVSLKENGRIRLENGINSYSRGRASNRPPKQIPPEEAHPHDEFSLLLASDVFQSRRDFPVPLPKIKVEQL